MTEGLRLAGTVEFAGLKAAPNYQRAHNVRAEQAAYLFPKRLNRAAGENEGNPWMGVPAQCAGYGAGYFCLAQLRQCILWLWPWALRVNPGAGVTGAMLSALATGDEPPVAVDQFRIDRGFFKNRV